MPESNVPHQLFRLAELQPGDVIVWQTYPAQTLTHRAVQATIQRTQSSFLGSPKGLDSTTHVSVVVSNKDAKPRIAHVTEDAEGDKEHGYHNEYIQQMLVRDGPRNFQVFRVNDSNLQQQVASVANSPASRVTDEQPKWSAAKNVQMMATPAKKIHPHAKSASGRLASGQKKPHQMNKNAICSSFAMNVMKIAIDHQTLQNPEGYKSYCDEIDKIRTLVSPKALENFFITSNNYSTLSYSIARDPCIEISKNLVIEINKLPREERAKMRKEMERAESALQAVSHKSPLHKAYIMMALIEPRLREINAKAANNVIAGADNIGVHVRDVRAYQAENKREMQRLRNFDPAIEAGARAWDNLEHVQERRRDVLNCLAKCLPRVHPQRELLIRLDAELKNKGVEFPAKNWENVCSVIEKINASLPDNAKNKLAKEMCQAILNASGQPNSDKLVSMLEAVKVANELSHGGRKNTQRESDAIAPPLPPRGMRR